MRAPTRMRSGFAWGLGLGGGCALAGGLMPLTVHRLDPVLPEFGTALIWAITGATIGLAGYTTSRMPAGAVESVDDDQPTWQWTGAAKWGGMTALVAGGTWFIVLSGWQRLIGPVPLDGKHVGGLLATVAGCAAVAGFYGLERTSRRCSGVAAVAEVVPAFGRVEGVEHPADGRP